MVEVNLPTWKLPYFIYLNDEKELEQEKALEKFEFIYSLSEYSLTMYEIIKMANILGEINDGQIWISPSDSEIFLKKLCDDKPKHFRDNMLRYANGIKANINPQKELQQIIPAIIDELEEMLQNGDWNYANLQTMKKVEWTLLEFDLERLEQIADWKKIDELRDECAVPSSTINKSHLPTNDEPPLAVHTFFKQYFIAKLDPKSMEQYNVNKVDCAIVNFGRELERRLVEDNSPIRNPGFSQYVKRMEAECGTGPHIKHDYLEPPTENTPSPMSKQLEMELFDEPLWNYARAIQIDSHTCKAVLQFADALSRIRLATCLGS
uniref:Uncharacterized protein n=1 Tax=Globodera pallida TaxID=36090 RepID=A0A183CB10_GLOPA